MEKMENTDKADREKNKLLERQEEKDKNKSATSADNENMELAHQENTEQTDQENMESAPSENEKSAKQEAKIEDHKSNTSQQQANPTNSSAEIPPCKNWSEVLGKYFDLTTIVLRQFLVQGLRSKLPPKKLSHIFTGAEFKELRKNGKVDKTVKHFVDLDVATIINLLTEKHKVGKKIFQLVTKPVESEVNTILNVYNQLKKIKKTRNIDSHKPTTLIITEKHCDQIKESVLIIEKFLDDENKTGFTEKTFSDLKDKAIELLAVQQISYEIQSCIHKVTKNANFMKDTIGEKDGKTIQNMFKDFQKIFKGIEVTLRALTPGKGNTSITMYPVEEEVNLQNITQELLYLHQKEANLDEQLKDLKEKRLFKLQQLYDLTVEPQQDAGQSSHGAVQHLQEAGQSSCVSIEPQQEAGQFSHSAIEPLQVAEENPSIAEDKSKEDRPLKTNMDDLSQDDVSVPLD